jgi:hypothetical protein
MAVLFLTTPIFLCELENVGVKPLGDFFHSENGKGKEIENMFKILACKNGKADSSIVRVYIACHYWKNAVIISV